MRRLLFALLALLTMAARPAAGQISGAEYASRRDSVAARIGNGFLLAFGQREPVDEMGIFRQLPEFNYLTGFQEVDAALLMVVRNGKVASALLYAPARDPRLQLYTGFLPESAAVVRSIGLGLRTLDKLQPALEPLIAEGLPLFTLPDVASRDFLYTDSLTRGRNYIKRLKQQHPALVIRAAHAMLDSLRVRKSPAEIALLRKAIDITMTGFAAAYQVIAPHKSEAIVQATAEYTWKLNGAAGPSYGGIVGSGPNSTSYHYRANDRVMQPGETLVMDIGALYNGYAADVTRTVPVSGSWTSDQRAIYQIVRDAQKAAEQATRAGVRVQVGDSVVRAVQARGLAELGLIESEGATFDAPWSCERRPLACKQVYLYQAHGLGHGIGLEVHDPGGYSYSPTGRFQVGEVFTIEPGIYISTKLLDMLPDTPKNRAFRARVRPTVERYHNIGIRIEDDYLVTPDGLEWLSRGPREADEIEAAMKKRT
ncbi:MAG: aminopeptidase P N-terminal domain-containing protein [Gemmatimonadota bacterium]